MSFIPLYKIPWKEMECNYDTAAFSKYMTAMKGKKGAELIFYAQLTAQCLRPEACRPITDRWTVPLQWPMTVTLVMLLGCSHPRKNEKISHFNECPLTT